MGRCSRWDLGIAAWLVVFTAAAFWRSLFFYFLSDDFVLLGHVEWPPGTLRSWFTTAGGDGFYRPVGYLSLALTSTWSGENPVLWHATALSLHATNTVLVYALAGMLGRSRAAAGFAAMLFAVHGTRPEAAVWMAGRFDLLATFFVLCGLLLYLRSRTLTSLACMALAILTKESAYVFPLLLVFLPVADLRSFWKRWIPFGVMAVGLFALRWSLLAGIGGYRSGETGEPQALTFSALKALEVAALRIWALLWFPINWSREPGRMLAVLATLYLPAAVKIAVAGKARSELLRWVGFVLVSILPPLHLLLIGPDLEKARLLYLPSVGFCLMLSLAADGLRGRMRYLAPCVVVLFHLAALQHNLDAWEYVAERARVAAAAAARCAGPGGQLAIASGVPRSLRGVPFFANGLEEAAALQRHAGVPPGAPSCLLVWDQTADELRAWVD